MNGDYQFMNRIAYSSDEAVIISLERNILSRWQKQAEDASVTQEPFHISSPSTTPPTSTPKPSYTHPTPTPTTGSLPLPKPSPLSLPAASQQSRALADSPAFNSAEPSTCPSLGALSQQTPAHTDSPASPKSTKSPTAIRIVQV
ncbi:putative uncharacterized protein DDB_G0290521 [Penaeus indicus]|uniref:putative uncharacterized protein DDB_G0290521 n=1 Tax=Penaeus indicus TaxID=29960 RepID=UPI00300D6A12